MAWTCKTGNNPKGCGGISGFATPDDGQFGAAAPDRRLRFDERYGIAVLQFYGTLEGNWLCGNPHDRGRVSGQWVAPSSTLISRSLTITD